ncbi:MAG TPA: ATP-binding protein [Methylomirabilota bacterium]|jgi:PAS domain S-box-containing protein
MRPSDSDRELPFPWLTGGGEMAQRMRSYDWAQTALGPPDRWPQSLRSAVSVCLGSRFPIVIYWGPDGVTLYNDGYVAILAGKHPWALGRPCREVWKEIWPVIGPMLEGVRTTGQATWSDDQLLFLHRHGYPEECYFSFSFGPVRGERGEIDGVFTAVIETTDRVLGERRLRILRELSVDGMGKSDADVCAQTASILALNPSDVPFALFFIVDGSARTADLLNATGIEPGALALGETVDLQATTRPAAILQEAIRTREAIEASPDAFVRALPAHASPEHVLVLPLLAGTQPAGVLVAGVSRHLALRGHYRDFFDLVASRVSTAIASGRAYQEERRRAEALADIDRAKTAFFSNVSHEFRTPLTLMLGPLQDRLASVDVPAELRAELEVVHRNGVRLLRLVNTLLDFSRIEAGRVDAVYEPTDLAAYTAELASVFRSAIERAGLRLVLDCPPLSEPIYVDREMWEKIVLNLLSNAFKFTFEGEIAVSVRERDDRVTLLVRDTGVGIAPGELPHIFERFHRVRGAQSRTHEGTGIGLALVQELVKLHRGEITARSQVNGGSTFAVVIPRGSSHLPPDRIDTARRRASTATGVVPYVAETRSWLPDDVVRVTEPAGSAPIATSGARVLLADDNADMREYLRRLLARHWTIEAVGDGRAALAAARTRVPDLVLTDVMMPGLDGFELLRELRADASTREVPVILLSARAGEESRVEGLEAGADGYLVKPFSARELIAHVDAHLKLKSLREKLQASLRESHQRLADELADMTRLQQVSTRLIGTDDLDALLLEIVDAAIAVTAANMANIQLLDPDAGTLKIVASRGFDAPFLKFFDTVHDGQAACGTAMRSGERVIIEDVAASPLFAGTPALDVMLAAKALAVQSTPLISRSGRLVGMFSTHYHTSRRPSDRELRLLDILARQAADAIERMQAEEGLRQRTEQFEALLDNAPLGVYLVDADFRIRQVNPVARPVFGDIPDLIGRDFDEVIHILWAKPYADEVVRLFRHTLETGEPYFTPERIEQRLDRGVTEYYEWRINRIPLPDGRHGVVCYFRDISGEVQARLAIAESAWEAECAKAEAEAANRAKDEFLATLSHELRTPLNSILGWTRMLRAGSLDAAATQRALEVVDRNVNHQNRLITDLLDISRIISGKLTLETAVVDLRAIVASVIEMLQPSAQAKSLSITPRLSRGAVPVDGDAERLRQVVTNLVSNAVKFTPSGGQVTVRLESAGDRVRLTVSDTGKGISAEFLPYIFERFRQADVTSTRAQAGLGLGLAIVRHIAELHGGSIRAESAGEGKGATFTVELPLALAGQDRSSVAEALAQNRMAGSPAKTLEGISVLIVEDDADSRELFATVLVSRGAEVTVVETVREALAVARAARPDVIVCDLAMPGEDGFAFIRTLRSWPGDEAAAIPALALTAYARLEDRDRALGAGFQLHMAKPVEPRDFVEAVAQLARRRTRHEPRRGW